MNDIEIQLKKLILDDDFTNIQSLVNEEINLMSILRVAHKELQHSNLLAWLFDTGETHGLGDYFIKEFIKLYYKENEYQDLGGGSSNLSVFDFVNLDFSDIEIKREHKNIDVLLLSESNSLCIVIENKIFAKEGKGQLTKYRSYIETEYPEFKHKIYIYLSLFEQEISQSESHYYVQLTYEHVKKLVHQILSNKNMSVRSNTRFVLEQYNQTLRTLMNENDEIEKIAKNLYGKYKSAFDLVFKYASPSMSGYVPHNLNELIKKEKFLRPFSSSRSYVRFQPEFLYDNIDKLKKNNILSQDDDLNSNWLFVYEFHITRTYIYFDMKIGEYHDQSSREALYKLYSAHADVFSKVKKANDKISPSWHLAFQKKIITTSEFDKYLDNEDKLYEIIGERFRELVDEDLPKINAIIEEVI